MVVRKINWLLTVLVQTKPQTDFVIQLVVMFVAVFVSVYGIQSDSTQAEGVVVGCLAPFGSLAARVCNGIC